MADSQELARHVLDQMVDSARDHQQLLAEFATRLEPFSKELVDAWTKAYCDASIRQPLPPEMVVRALQEEAVKVLIGGLRQANVRLYYGEVARWAYRMARSGLTFDRAVLLLREYQRCCLPFVRQLYVPGAELEMVLAALDDLYGGTVGLVGAVYLQAAQELLLETTRLRSLGYLTVGAMHALNNLNTTILGKTQLLYEKARDTELRSELQEILRTAAAGAQMVRRLQDYARTGREEKEIECDVNALVREAGEITRFVWRDQSEASGIIIDVVRDLADVPAVNAYPNDLRQVLVALILNSIEAMPHGGLITLRTERKGDQVLVSVIDTGEGMSEETRLHVLDPFFTTKGPPHTGLGLSAVSEVVSRHKGALAIESLLGRGSTFTIAIPVAVGAVPPAPEKTAIAQVAPTSPSAIRILIIDDEPAVRDIVAKFLAFRGFQVAVADSGRDGIAAFKKNGFDLVVTDLGMPGLSGWDVAREIKRLNPKTIVVLMSGWSAELEARRLKENGVDRVVHKPFDVDDILNLVNEAVGMREAT